MTPEPRKPRLKHYAEYAAIRGVTAALDALSWRAAGAVGAGLGAFAYRPIGIRRDVVETQIADSFPEFSIADVRRVARGAYAHLGRVSIETALLPSLSRDRVLELFEGVTGWELVENAVAAGRGLLFVTGHLGNWELGGAYLAARGIPLDAVVRQMGNPLFDHYLNDTRGRLGVTVVYDMEAVRRIPRSLREGRAIALLVDQGVLGLASTYVPFFGRLAKTPRGPAVFALRLKVPLIFGTAIRQPDGRYRLILETVPVEETGDRERDVDQTVARYTRVLERYVRLAPEQYFWHHRRWKRQPKEGERIVTDGL
ncbi:MAG TPA: lysophospholipid acyltransferase family protein [Gemmatimonadaceae bacterium]|nr:lysophospholipid acyltransferase family protein [Gemmatimonadaceae bacterium]